MVTKPYPLYCDLLIKNSEGQPTLIVEVKGRINTSSQWAAQLRRNILAHGILPKAPYFLLAFPDKFYLWTDSQVDLNEREPNYIIDARPILEPYLKKSGVTVDRIRDESLELIVASWLGEIIHFDKLPADLNESQPWLIDSGLYADLVGGTIKFGAIP